MGIFGFFILAAAGYFLYRNYFTTNTYETKDERYNAARAQRQKELDGLLDKINRRGMSSLSERERQRLDELSGK
ncbi:DUF6576 domain-containing protein [Chryseolinea sp. T2]|uniref:DUF6576 domain-containing protein n=1 Tax=Chryseolinea sp. T2 TaxID=3129255 RepID=UPI0030779034